jgi:hypothetical protein
MLRSNREYHLRASAPFPRVRKRDGD